MTPEAVGQLVSVALVSVSLDGVPEEYHDFADVFSKYKARVLEDHHPYDLEITLEGGASPPSGLVMEKFSSEPRFKPRMTRTKCSILFNVQLGP